MDCHKQDKLSTTSKIPTLLLWLVGIAVVFIFSKLMNIKIGTLLPYGIFLLLHVFMMRGHGNHGKDHKSS